MQVRIERKRLDELIPAEYHPRIPLAPGDPMYQALAGSIERFGYVEPIIWNARTGHVVGGHQRLRVLRDQGVSEVDVSVVDLDEQGERALNLALNRIRGQWDEEQLAEVIAGLEASGYDLEVTGFGPEEIDRILAGLPARENDRDPDAAPPELILLGPHRLLCGDATDVVHVERLMGGELADLVWTDPPYNVAYEDTRGRSIQNDNLGPGEFLDFLCLAFNSYRAATKPGAVFYVCYASKEHTAFERAMRGAELEIRSQIIWVKNLSTFGWAHYKWQHEPILYAAKRGEAPGWYGDRKQTTVWRESGGPLQVTRDGAGHLITFTDGVRTFFARVAGLESVEEDGPGGSTVWTVSRETGYAHPTQKPVELVERAIRNSSLRGDLVLDLFGGSGSTLIAAERMGRTAYLMELDPRWCDVIVRRWEEYTGQPVRREVAA